LNIRGTESTMTTIAQEKKESYNIFRDSLLRYAGYANEVGESFRYQFPKFVVPSYAISFGYCFADAASTGWTSWNEEKGANARQETLFATVDTLVWQSLASVMIPGAIINAIVKASRFAVRRSPLALPVLVGEWLPTATGLGSVPLIVHPIDHYVDMLLDNTTRQWWRRRQDQSSAVEE
jgi:fission process protein 1